MTNYYFDESIAQKIVDRTMLIIDSNVNVMDAKGRIIGSGDLDRVGEMHEGALLVLAQKRIVNIDKDMAQRLQGVRPGVNLPLHIDGHIIGVIGLTGEPKRLQKYAELVCMTAEMMLEQTYLLRMLAQDSRLREELVLNLIREKTCSPVMLDWAQRLGIDLNMPRIVIIIELDSGQLTVKNAMAELQQLQTLLMENNLDNLIAIIPPDKIVILKAAVNGQDVWDIDRQRTQLIKLIAVFKENSGLDVCAAMGKFFSEEGGIARSYRTAVTTMQVGKQRFADKRYYCYQELVFPVLLDALRDSWQRDEILMFIKQLKLSDRDGLLRGTLIAWFNHNAQAIATSNSLKIHRNTLDYRLKRVEQITHLNLNIFDNRLLLYMALLLDDDSYLFAQQ